MVKKLSHSGNNFDFLRLAAALLVFYSHSFALYGLHEPVFILSQHHDITMGIIAVGAFFTISGFLVTRSFLETGDINKFISKRFLRIYPGYLVNTIFIIFIFAPLISKYGMSGYFREISAIWYRLFIGMFHFSNIPHLPGVFEGNKFSLVNGPLWTLFYEMLCYAGIAVLGLTKLLNRKTFWLVPLALLIANIFIIPVETEDLAYIHICTFFIGAFFYIYFGAKMVNKWLAVICLSGLILMSYFNIYFLPLYSVLIGYFVLCFALMNNKFSSAGKYGDFSYGIYIYSWPIQQFYAEIFGNDPKYFIWYFISGLFTVLILSIFSWKLIEKPALNLVKIPKPHEV